jgi:hypothetical protein
MITASEKSFELFSIAHIDGHTDDNITLFELRKEM